MKQLTMNGKAVCMAFLMMLVAHWVAAQLTTYGPIPGFTGYSSSRYDVRVKEASGAFQNSHVHHLVSTSSNMTDSHWSTFSYGGAGLVEVEITFNNGNINSYEFRPTHVSQVVQSGNKLNFKIASNKYVSVIINGNMNHPIFIFCDPAETQVPNPSGADVYFVAGGSSSLNNPLTIRDIGSKKIVYFGPGEHFINESDTHGYTPQSGNQAFFVCANNGNRIEGNQIEQIYIHGEAIVHGNIRATRAENLIINGRGILEGEDTYGYSSGDYFSSQILSSAINMAAYKDQASIFIPDMNQTVDGITSILPRKYNIQVGTGALVRNCKMFAYHQTTDGIGVEANSVVRNNFMKVNDDALKLYQDDCLFENNYIWHQMNGAAMMLGWDKEEGDDILVKNTYLLACDMYRAGYFNEGFWANQSIISWLKHFPSPDDPMDLRDNIVIDGINNQDMPDDIGFIRLLAIAMDGQMGGGGAGSLNMTIKNVSFGEEDDDTPSYVGAASGHFSNVTFENVYRDGNCMDQSNVSARGSGSVSISGSCGSVSNYTISVTQTANGNVAPGTVTVSQGSSQSFSITPNSGYQVSDVLVDGSSVGAVSSYNFSNVNSNHSITATFTGVSSGNAPVAGSTVWIKNVATGLYLNTQSTADFAVVSGTNSPNSSAEWEVEKTGTYYRFKHVEAAKRMRPENTNNGSSIQLGKSNWTGNWTQWALVNEGNDRFRLVNKFTGKHLRFVSATEGSNAEQAPTSDASSSTLWVFEDPSIGAGTNAYQTWQAESSDADSGGLTTSTWCQPHIGQIDGGEWIRFDQLNFGSGSASFTVHATAGYERPGSYVEIRLDSPSGTLAGSVEVTNTGGWCSYTDFTANLNASGLQDVYVVFVGSTDIYDLDWISFSQNGGARVMDGSGSPSEPAEMMIYPNPASDVFHIRVKGIEGPYHLELINLSGSRIYSDWQSGGETLLSATQLNLKGVMIAKVTSEDRVWISRLVIR
ncbi:carbohydrate-binding protein [Reichenbachiella ulvae]|uniref:Carbohydrate-binding protein n=1 Tax=Reichenbachiella ulvae TaxID=2980104 RepID=A0ABT3D086_9BACT|nr:carbohydrate-binding protein [Reichenbachiella ulvae]MCV9389297.1 carbohydrate-binding protein [Reichenbachiella ulvae]